MPNGSKRVYVLIILCLIYSFRKIAKNGRDVHKTGFRKPAKISIPVVSVQSWWLLVFRPTSFILSGNEQSFHTVVEKEENIVHQGRLGRRSSLGTLIWLLSGLPTSYTKYFDTIYRTPLCCKALLSLVLWNKIMAVVFCCSLNLPNKSAALCVEIGLNIVLE